MGAWRVDGVAVGRLLVGLMKTLLRSLAEADVANELEELLVVVVLREVAEV